MKNFIFTIIVAIAFISFSHTSAREVPPNHVENFERTHNQEQGSENNEINDTDDDPKSDIDESYTPEELDGKDRTN